MRWPCDEPDDYDEFSIWVNPSAGDANSPDAVAEGDFDNLLAVSLDALGMRAFNQEPGDAMFWDAMRIGTTWDDVTSKLGDGVVTQPGDFDSNGSLDEADIDALTEVVKAGTDEVAFDLNSDGMVNGDDRSVWVQDLKKTWFGDSNLDGEFNSSDFVVVFQTGEYEDATDGNSTWGEGDWNGDGDFNSSDFVVAFQGGGFEVGPRAATSSVPEPSAIALLLIGLSAGCRVRSRR